MEDKNNIKIDNIENKVEDDKIAIDDEEIKLKSKEIDNKTEEKLKVNDIKVEVKTEICKIKYIKNNKVAVTFKGYGIMVDLGDIEIDNNKKTIAIQYTSDIGKSDFKYWIEEK